MPKEGSERDPRHDPWFVDGRDVKTPYSVEEVRQMVALCDDDPGTWTPRNRRLMATVLSLADSISETVSPWVKTDERNPDDEQMVLACWGNNDLGTVRYFAADAPDSRERWMDGPDALDRPDYWQPLKGPQ